MNQSQFEESLIKVALKRLSSCQADQLMPFTWRKNGDAVLPEGSSFRYTAISLIGLQSAVLCGLLESGKVQAKERMDTLRGSLRQVNNYGDMGLFLFAAALQSGQEIHDIIEMTWQRMQADLIIKNNPYETMWLSWLLDGFCAAAKLRDKKMLERIRLIAKRLLHNQDINSGLFYRTRNWSNVMTKLKGQISFFCDQVYPIHALSSAYLIAGEKEYLDAVNKCAQRLTQLQGPSGEWWWIYNIPNGTVAEPFPVYSVHQHGMAPMALRQLRKAGGLDLEISCSKGIHWLVKNKLRINMVDGAENIIWRSHRRVHMKRLITISNQIASVLFKHSCTKSAKNLQVDWECRPYELGWLLYAYSLRIV